MLPILPRLIYKNLMKPMLFMQDAEKVHDRFTNLGERLGKNKLTKKTLRSLLSYNHKNLEQEIDGILFKNPVGLAAGFNYDGHMAEILTDVGFGFHTVGTVTAKEYEGNQKPRLGRLPKSKSLLVNKGFKSKGAKKVEKILDGMNLEGSTVGLSVGSSNIPEVSTIKAAIEDYIFTFNLFKNKKYISYFELNISCPNTAMPESFTEPKNLKKLLDAVEKLKIKKPVYIKMPNEKSIKDTNKLTDIAVEYDFIKGFVFSNLVKKRNNRKFDKDEVKEIKHLKGNFSGKPTSKNSLKLIRNARKRYGNDITIIGCGGVFSARDAKRKLDAGANLVQLITGMIFEGPQLIGEINKSLKKYF